MSQNDAMIAELMKALRVKSDTARDEITGLVDACKKDLEIAGVYVEDENDPLCRQAIKLYCKSYYGYDKDTEKFMAAYAALKDSMALSGDYKKAGDQSG